MKFENAPLIELIAEVRWGRPSVTLPVPQQTPHASVFINADADVSSFADRVAGHGYVLSERLVPLGMPVVAFQASHRFRRPNVAAGEGTSLFAIGNGVFSISITPPYKTWHAFRPVVEMGIDALLKSRRPGSTISQFATISLRYVNAFNKELTGGRSIVEFLNLLGFGANLPPIFNGLIDQGRPVKPLILAAVPLHGGRSFNVNIGHAVINGEDSILMDNAVVTGETVSATLASVMAELDTARAAIHEVFVSSTKPIEKLLRPIEE